MDLRTFINLGQIVLAITLIVLVLLQAKGNSASAFFNRDAATTYRTRRGVERTILQATIAIAILLCLVSLFNNMLPKLGF